MDEDDIMRELTQVARVVVTAGGQWRERHARAAADQDRARQAALAEDQHRIRSAADAAARAEQERQRAEIAAGRAVYGEVRRIRWDHDTTPRRVGEAFVAASALAEHDTVARSAQRYLVAEVRARYGPRADEWLTAAIAEWQELQRSEVDQVAADRDAETQREALASSDPEVVAEAESQAGAAAAAGSVEHQREQQASQVGWAVSQSTHQENRAGEHDAERAARDATATLQHRADVAAEAKSPVTPPELIAAQLGTARQHRLSYPRDPADELNAPRSRSPRRAKKQRRPRMQRERDQGRSR